MLSVRMVRHAKVLVPTVVLLLLFGALLHTSGHSPVGAIRKPAPVPTSVPVAPEQGIPDGTSVDVPEIPTDNVEVPKQEPETVEKKYSLWTDDEIKEIPSRKYEFGSWAELHQDSIHNREPRMDERARYESSEVWLNDHNMLPVGASSDGLPRPKIPQREDFEQVGEYLRQPILGDFKSGADKVFVMLKTSADTQWKRMPIHFMTTLTRAKNFGLYSDAPGTMFGHEIIDILKDLPENVLEESEFDRIKAHRQSHDEHWNWAPDNLKGDGGWNIDRYKNIPMLYDAWKKNPNCDWYIWVDDDSFIFYDNMIKWFETMDPSELIYTGNYVGGAPPFAHGGSVAVVSRGIVEGLFGPNGKVSNPKEWLDHWAERTVPVCCGDLMVAVMLIEEFDIYLYKHPIHGDIKKFGYPFQREPLDGLIIPKEDFCTPIATFHHLNNHQMEMLWEYERLWDRDRFITHDDIYRDFYLPYVTEERPNWKIYDAGEAPEIHTMEGDSPRMIEYNDETFNALTEKEECKRLCAAKDTCSGWSFKPGRCHLSSIGFNFGSAQNDWNGEPGWVSGYMVDRIREWRAESPCDPLQKDWNGVYNDDDSTSEGWMVRRLENPLEKTDGAKDKDSSIPNRYANAQSI